LDIKPAVTILVLTLKWLLLAELKTSRSFMFVPANLQGRVSRIDYLVSSALLPIGYGLAGIAADRLGASLVFGLGGAITASMIALGFLHPAVRAVD
jgi:hypothetical protein